MTYPNRFLLFLVTLLLSGPMSTLAQSPTGTESTAAATSDEAPNGDATARYEAAVEALARGDRELAIHELRQLVAEHPDHPVTAKANSILAEHDEKRDRKNRRAGRAELAIGQLLHGAALGVEVCVLADCNNPRVWSGATLAGVGIGLTASLLATRDGVNQATAMSANLGTIWGAWSSYALFGASSRLYRNDNGFDDRDYGKRTVATLMAGQVGGLGLGLLADHYLKPTKGEVAGATAGGLWAGGLTGLLWAMKDDLNTRALHGGLFAASQLGLIGGYFLAKHQNFSRSRALMLNTGGFIGGGLGALSAFLIGGDKAEADAYLAGSAAGIAAGLGLTYFLTRNWDKPDWPVDLSVSPTKGGASASLTIQLP